MPAASTTNGTVYDAILLTSFGGPEGPEDVIPFLENVLRGKPVPRERLLEVAEHYQSFGGVSPINQQCRDLIAALEPALKQAGVDLPVYWGNRNWEPMLPDTLKQMAADGVNRALALVTSSYSSYSGCRQYREDLCHAREAVGDEAPAIDKVRVWYNHPDWIAVNAERVRDALDDLPADVREHAHVAFTAHSIPNSMADTSDYARQLHETCRLVAEALEIPQDRWALVYQSRSGRPGDPWLEPDVCDHLEAVAAAGVRAAVVAPIGFVSDHMEVLFDLDEEARARAEELGLAYRRAGTAGTHPRFVSMLVELIRERLGEVPQKRAVGEFRPNHDVCPKNCCPNPYRPSPV
ncbi:ferrochelatase [Alienimonas californiensis]|uniref:Ferrochelatase n=1 Tax=Alienimonas californiensis TaxID=2527989 RepID=A0A517P9M4_9PLAN|nr:ferrochelatase [Alienimonas californiensis]QDT16071.1 Ferrochelatase [Alienimonas californiensis]